MQFSFTQRKRSCPHSSVTLLSRSFCIYGLCMRIRYFSRSYIVVVSALVFICQCESIFFSFSKTANKQYMHQIKYIIMRSWAKNGKSEIKAIIIYVKVYLALHFVIRQMNHLVRNVECTSRIGMRQKRRANKSMQKILF